MTSLETLELEGLALGPSVDTTSMFKDVSSLKSITLNIYFVFGSATDFPFAGTAEDNFWIADITTRMDTTYDKWNSYLDKLPAVPARHTFTIATRTYAFDANGGSFDTNSNATSTISYYGNENDPLGQTPKAARTGYIQNGWWTDATAGTQVSVPATFGADPEVTVYAHWDRDPNYAEVSFNTNGANETIAPVLVKKGQKITAPSTTLTRDNATFKGWMSDTALENAYNFNDTVQNDMTLYARWEAATPSYVALFFNPNGGTFVETQIIARGERPSVPDAPTLANATFDTWCEDRALTRAFAFGPLNEDTTVYARWKPADPTRYAVVTFNPNGGSFVPSQVVALGSSAMIPATPTLANAIFNQWCEDTSLQTPYVFGPVTGPTTVYASWNAVDPATYSVVTFDTQGGSFVDSQIVKNGTTAVRPEQVPTKEGATFDNWYADASAQQLFNFAAPINQNTRVYAGWNHGPCIVTFNANGLTFSDGTTSKTLKIEFGADIVAPALTIPADRDFVGWFTAATGETPCQSVVLKTRLIMHRAFAPRLPFG